MAGEIEHIKGKGFDKHPENINKSGRPIGSRNRSTIVKEIFDISGKFPDKVFQSLKAIYPTIEQEMNVEEIMTVIQADKAIRHADTAAYRALMDSAYGAPQQSIESVNDRLTEIKIYEIKKND